MPKIAEFSSCPPERNKDIQVVARSISQLEDIIAAFWLG
jgi:hypothetical protein